jgi:hypothetical protein
MRGSNTRVDLRERRRPEYKRGREQRKDKINEGGERERGGERDKEQYRRGVAREDQAEVIGST